MSETAPFRLIRAVVRRASKFTCGQDRRSLHVSDLPDNINAAVLRRSLLCANLFTDWFMCAGSRRIVASSRSINSAQEVKHARGPAVREAGQNGPAVPPG